MNDYLNYGEYNPEMSEYNPRSAQLEQELRNLVERVESPKTGVFGGLMKKILLLSSLQN